MKKRIIVAVIAIPVLLAVIFFAPVWVLAALVGAIAAGAAWELLRCISPEEPLRRKVESCACAFLIPALTAFFPADSVRFIMIFALFALLMCELMLSFRSGEPIPLSAVKALDG